MWFVLYVLTNSDWLFFPSSLAAAVARDLVVVFSFFSVNLNLFASSKFQLQANIEYSKMNINSYINLVQMPQRSRVELLSFCKCSERNFERRFSFSVFPPTLLWNKSNTCSSFFSAHKFLTCLRKKKKNMKDKRKVESNCFIHPLALS
jgi:hypothetical protein